jgi:hypothetical protein
VQSLLVTIVFLLAYLFTVPDHIGDTYWYGLDVSRYLGGPAMPDQGRLWEFAHLLWRPLAYLLYKLFGGMVASMRGPDVTANVIWVMMAVSAVFGWLCCLFLNRVLVHICGPWAGLFLTASFLCTNSVLNETHSGTSYIPGLAFLCLSCWIAQRAVVSPSPRYGWAIGISLAAAALMWIPYVLSLPIVLALEFVWGRKRKRERMVLIGRTTAAFALTLVLVYGVAIWAQGIRSMEQLSAWIVRSRNGTSQTENWMRAVPGVARSFVNLGDAGLKLKQYVKKDPYARIRLTDVISGAVLGMTILYAGFAFLLLKLWKPPESRPALWILLGSWALMMILAIRVFEPSSPERYFPVFPITYIAIAQTLRGALGSWKPVAFAGMAVLIGLNLLALSNMRSLNGYSAALERQTQLDRAAANNAIATVIEDDPLNVLPQVHPLDPLLRPRNFQVRSAVAPGTLQAKNWRSDFREMALHTWRNGSEVWISKRLLAPSPKPEWHWVEGENGSLWWNDVRSFFGSFETDRESQGEDGFLRVAHSPANQSLIAGAQNY